jgi:hypothetical protein
MITPDVYARLREAIWGGPSPLLKLAELLWPQVYFYDKQREIFQSLEDNDETVVPAGNQLGKDFTAGAVCICFFLRGLFNGGCRVVTTSVKDDHLRVLWGEIGRFLQTSAVPLRVEEGGPLVVNHRDIRGVVAGKVCQISYLRGMVSERGEGMAGHHAKNTLAVIDEACHDSETEVLTDEGWKFFKDLHGDENFLTMDPETRNACYLPATSVHESYRSGPMYLYERRCGNFCVTPNHRMLWRTRRPWREQPYSDYFLEEISSLNGSERSIPRCFNWQGNGEDISKIEAMRSIRKIFPERTVPTDKWVELLGWYVAEGSLGFSRGDLQSVSISQHKSTEAVNRIAGLAKDLGFSPLVYNSGGFSGVRINERRLAELMFKMCGRKQPERRAPAFIGNLSPTLIEKFLQAFKEGDGYDKNSGREILYTSSPKLADDLQVLSYKAGRESTVCKRSLIGIPAPNGTARHDGLVVGRSREGLDSHLKVKRKHLQVVDYAGVVYCVTVPPYHTLFTRRKGVCMWSGNSGVDDFVYTQMSTWAKKFLIFGNCNPTANFFFKAVEGGDLVAS